MKYCEAKLFLACYDGQDNSAYVPQFIAHECVELLFENSVAAKLVNREFDAQVQDYGDTVKVGKPLDAKIKRRTDTTVASTLNQVASSDYVNVTLNQQFNETFTLRPREQSLAMPDLVRIYLKPRMQKIASGLDRAILGRAASLLPIAAKRAGRLNNLTGQNAYAVMLEAEKILNDAKAPQDERSLILSSAGKSQMFLCDRFSKANERGDGGVALKTGILGEILGFDTYLDQNIGAVVTGADAVVGAVTAAHAAGGKDDQLATGVTAAVAGEFAVVAGNDQPTWIASVDAEGAGFTLNEANKYATDAGAAVTVYKAAAVSGAYAAGYAEEITITGYTVGKAPQIGQLIAFGTVVRQTYKVIEATDNGASATILLDRPLDYALGDTDAAYPGPYGSLNLAWHVNGLTLVSRPLAIAHAVGIEFAVADINGLGVRVAMQQKINEGLVVAIDVLAGVGVLNQDLVVPVFG